MEAKTIKTTAAALGIADASVRRTLKRWIDDAEKSRLFTNAQRSFIQSIKADTVWPDWLDAIWCENYQPRTKDALKGGIVRAYTPKTNEMIEYKQGVVYAPGLNLLDKTAVVFEGAGEEPEIAVWRKTAEQYRQMYVLACNERDQLATKLELAEKTLTEYEAEIDTLRNNADEWEKMSNTDRAKYIETRKDLEGLERELADANAEIAEHASTIKQMRNAMFDMGVKHEKELADASVEIIEKITDITILKGHLETQKSQLETADEKLIGAVNQITNLTHERDQEAESAREAFAVWQEAMAKIEAYEADTWRKRIADAVKYAFSDYLIPKVVLLAFQSYIYAMYVMRVFAFLNTQVGKRADIAETYADTVLHEPWFYGMWVLGFFVDGAGFAIAQKLSEPKYLSDGDTRLTWIGWFFVLQVVIDMCYLFGTFHPIIEWFGAVVIVVAPALGIMAYARATFKKGQA